MSLRSERENRPLTLVRVGHGLVLLSLVASSLTLSATASARVSSFVAKPSVSTCKDVIFIGAAGSGENTNPQKIYGGRLDPNRGLGPEVNKIARRIEDRFGTNNVQIIAVQYPAHSVFNIAAPGGLIYYTFGLNDGITATMKDTEVVARTCKNSVLVLAGYSQGAMVVHDAEDRLALVDRGALDHIAGTILIADGDRISNSKDILVGNPAATRVSEGIRPYFHNVESHDLPNPNFTINICTRNDIVCDTNLLHTASGISIHLNYGSGSNSYLLIQAADRVASWANARLTVGGGGGGGGGAGGGGGGGGGGGSGTPVPTNGSISIGWSTVHPTWITMTLSGFAAGNYTYTCNFASGGNQSFTVAVTGNPETFDNGATCYDGIPGDVVWVTIGSVTSNQVTVGASSPPPPPPPPAPTFAETTGPPVATRTFTNYLNAGGIIGPSISIGETVQVSCRAQGQAVSDGDTWWYNIASGPWNSTYWAPADNFYNDGATSGSLAGTPFYDPNVPVC